MDVSKKKRVKLSAFDYAIYLLSSRLLSSGQLHQKLAKKNYAEEETAEVISRLTQLRYLNDQQFAQIYFENLKKYKFFGYFGLKKKLLEKKLSPEIVEGLLSGLSAAEEYALAKKAVLKKSGKTPEQLVRFLQSKGFRSAAIFKSVKVNKLEE